MNGITEVFVVVVFVVGTRVPEVILIVGDDVTAKGSLIFDTRISVAVLTNVKHVRKRTNTRLSNLTYRRGNQLVFTLDSLDNI